MNNWIKKRIEHKNEISYKNELKLILNDKKYCKKCKSWKPLTDFGTSQKRSQCKSCYSIWRKEYYKRPNVKEKERKYFLQSYFKRAYGITFDQYQGMLLKQNGKCAICDKEQEFFDFRSSKRINLNVDHCHKTGKVRGLLCINCNQGIGFFKDNIDIINSAIKYLLINK